LLHQRSTKYHGLHTNVSGTPTVFSVKEEKMFITVFVKFGKWGYPLDLNDIRYFAKSYLDKVGKKIEKFKNNLRTVQIYNRSMLRNIH